MRVFDNTKRILATGADTVERVKVATNRAISSVKDGIKGRVVSAKDATINALGVTKDRILGVDNTAISSNPTPGYRAKSHEDMYEAAQQRAARQEARAAKALKAEASVAKSAAQKAAKKAKITPMTGDKKALIGLGIAAAVAAAWFVGKSLANRNKSEAPEAALTALPVQPAMSFGEDGPLDGRGPSEWRNRARGQQQAAAINPTMSVVPEDSVQTLNAPTPGRS